jgi:hypothetical protein
LYSFDPPPPKPVLVVPTEDLEFFRKHVELGGDWAIVTDTNIPEDYDG